MCVSKVHLTQLKVCTIVPVAEEPLINIINSWLSLGHAPKPFKLAVIKPLIKKTKLDPSELANYRPISNLQFMSKKIEKVLSVQFVLLLAKKIIDKIISINNFSQVLCPTIAQKIHSLKLQMTCFLHQTKAVSHC